MKRQRLILKSMLFMILIYVVYLKVKTPDPDWIFEVTTDLTIVLIALGVAEVMILSIYNSISQFSKFLQEKP